MSLKKRSLSFFLSFALFIQGFPAAGQDLVPSQDQEPPKQGKVYSPKAVRLFTELFFANTPMISSLTKKEQSNLLKEFLENRDIKISRAAWRALLQFVLTPSSAFRTNDPIVSTFREKNTLIEANRKTGEVTIQIKNRTGTNRFLIQSQDIRHFLEIIPGKQNIQKLREFFTEVDIPIRDKKILRRIAREYYKALEQAGIRRPGYSVPGQQTLVSEMDLFIQAVQEHYELPLTGKEKRVLDLLDQILSRTGVAKRDIVLFRRALHELGIPSHLLSEEFLRDLMVKELKVEYAQQDAKRRSFSDKAAAELLKRIKYTFNRLTFSNFQPQSLGLAAHGKNFLIQFVVFQMVLGAQIFREYLTDFIFYKAPKNPDPMNLVLEQFGWNAAVAFGGFYAAYVGTEKKLQKWGKKLNSPFLKGVAPIAAMGVAYVINQFISDAWGDKEIFTDCLQTLMDRKAKEGIYINSCEQAFFDWLNSGQWKGYGIDSVAIISASLLSGLSVNWGGALLRKTPWGSAFFSRFIPFGSFIGFAITFYAFVEIYNQIDKHYGKARKEYLLIKDLESDIQSLNRTLENLSTREADLLMRKGFRFLKNAISTLDEEDLKRLVEEEEGRQFFSQIVSSLKPEELEELEEDFYFAKRKQEYGISDSEGLLYIQPLQEMFMTLASEGSNPLEEDQDITDLRKNIVSQIKTMGLRFAQWVRIKGEPYQQAFFFWQNKTYNIMTSYTSAEELLGTIYDRSQGIDQLLEQWQTEVNALRSERDQRIEQATEYDQTIAEEYNERIKDVNKKYHGRLQKRIEFFTLYLDRINGDNNNNDNNGDNNNRWFYTRFICPYLKDSTVNEEVRQFRGKLGWIEWCAQPGQVKLEGKFIVHQILPILNAMLKEKFPEVFKETAPYDMKEILEDYLSDIPDELFANEYEQIGASFFERADLQTKAKIARAFTEAAYKSQTEKIPISHWVWKKMVDFSCIVTEVEDLPACQTAWDKGDMRYQGVFYYALGIIRDKLAAAAIYLLKEVLIELPSQSSYISSGDRVIYETQFAPHQELPLINFVEVYKPLEELFVEDKKDMDSPEKFLSPYTFMYDFICGTPKGTVHDGWFSAPQMVSGLSSYYQVFPERSSVCDFLNHNKMNFSDKDLKATLRKRYFHTPVIEEVMFPSISEAMMEQIRGWFQRKEDLLNIFGERTKRTIQEATETMRKELANLKTNYIVPGFINKEREVLGITQCFSIRDYYTTDHWDDLPQEVVGYPTAPRSPMNSYTGLEIYLFQIQFWLERIRTINSLAEGKDLKVFDPSKKPLDEAFCAVMEMFKSYHDVYASNQSFTYLTLEETQTIKAMNLSDALLELSTKKLNSGNVPVLISPSLALSLILKPSYPEWDNDGFRLFLGNNRMVVTEQEALEHSLVKELWTSLIGFYTSLGLLDLSDSMENVVERKQSGIQSIQELFFQ